MSLPQRNSPSRLDSAQRDPGKTDRSAPAVASLNSAPTREFSPAERSVLLELAHNSIASALQGTEISLDAPTPPFAEVRGAFTSIYMNHAAREPELRGCVGYVLPTCSVYRAVAETARAAAFEDRRFPPVTREEAANLLVELSILTPPRPIQPDEIEVGRHGLLLSLHGRRGLLLPQVAVEHEWDRTTFLEQTCKKAGLSPAAWREGATIEAFTAEIFGDKSVGD